MLVPGEKIIKKRLLSKIERYNSNINSNENVHFNGFHFIY
jgi:hypothetical protein